MEWSIGHNLLAEKEAILKCFVFKQNIYKYDVTLNLKINWNECFNKNKNNNNNN